MKIFTFEWSDGLYVHYTSIVEEEEGKARRVLKSHILDLVSKMEMVSFENRLHLHKNAGLISSRAKIVPSDSLRSGIIEDKKHKIDF